MKKASDRLHAMLHGFVNKMVDENLNSVDLEDRHLRKINVVIPSRRPVKKVTEAMLRDQYNTAPVKTIFKKKTRKSVDAGSEKKDPSRKLVDVSYSTGGRPVSSRDQLPTDSSDEQTNEKGYSDMSE